MLSYTTALVTGTCCNQQFSCFPTAQLSECLLKASLTLAGAKHRDSGVSMAFICVCVCSGSLYSWQEFPVSRDECHITHYCLSYTHSDNQPAY